ncbi:MAG: hypothetical protein AB3N63_04940 [Puniceicoccaceae bacterium]
MTEALTIDGYGATIRGDYARGFLPENIKDLGRFSVSMESGSRIRGGVLCSDLNCKEGPFQIDGAIYASGSIDMVNGREASLIGGPVSAGRSILTRMAPYCESPVRIVGDVGAKRISLEGAVVFGNVSGEDVYLKNSIVFGFAHSASKLRLEDSAAFTFLGNEVEIHGKTGVMHALAAAKRKIEKAGDLYLLSLKSNKDSANEIVPIPCHGNDLRRQIVHKEDGTNQELQVFTFFDRIINLNGAQRAMNHMVEEMEAIVFESRKTEPDWTNAQAFEESIRHALFTAGKSPAT